MNRLSIVAGLALVVVAVIFFVIFRWPTGSGQPERSEPVIRVALFQAPASVALDKLKARFEQEFHAKVIVELLPYDELQSKIEQQFQTGTSNYDVIMVDCILIPAYASRGMLSEINPAVWTKSDLAVADLMPALDDYLSRFPKGGKRYGMPFMSNTHMMAYRRSVVAPIAKQLGLNLPGTTSNSAWTWDEYLKVAKAITAARKNDRDPYGTSLQARAGAWIVYEWYSVLFGFVRDTKARATGLPLFGEDAAKAMDFYKSLYSAAPPDALTWGHEEETAAMCSDVSAMDATSNVELAANLLKPECSRNGEGIDFAYPPLGASGQASPDMGGYGLLVTAQSQQKDLAAKFVFWAASPDVHRQIVLEGGSPIRNSELKIPEVRKKFPYLSFYDQLIQTSIYRARIPEWLQLQDKLSRDLVTVMKGEQPAAAATQDVNAWVAANVN
jgi:multiple sugar transport system substrate-binding protein